MGACCGVFGSIVVFLARILPRGQSDGLAKRLPGAFFVLSDRASECAGRGRRQYGLCRCADEGVSAPESSGIGPGPIGPFYLFVFLFFLFFVLQFHIGRLDLASLPLELEFRNVLDAT